jgi:FlaA1/EpsC-like NDP-sugar epimerase
MISVNILNAIDLCEIAERQGCRKFFAVSTDKAVRPVNLMGASKSVMELFLMRAADGVPVSTARFANVAFSDGSLLYGFEQRVRKRQPSAPARVRRYFITAGSRASSPHVGHPGRERDIFFPRTGSELRLTSFPRSPADLASSATPLPL